MGCDYVMPLNNGPFFIVEFFLLIQNLYLNLFLQVLQTEVSVLKHNQSRVHELSTYLMLSDNEEITKVTRSHMGSKATDDQARLDLMHRLQV